MSNLAKKIRSVLFLASIFLFLQSCGFHFRGMMDMPQWLDSIAIISQSQREMTSALKEQFQAYHIKVCDSPAEAHYWLMIENETFQQQIMSISSSTTPRQYQLNYHVQFKLQNAHGAEKIPLNQVFVTRQITINSDRILGSDEEEAITKNEMRRDAAIQILNRLNRYS